MVEYEWKYSWGVHENQNHWIVTHYHGNVIYMYIITLCIHSYKYTCFHGMEQNSCVYLHILYVCLCGGVCEHVCVHTYAARNKQWNKRCTVVEAHCYDVDKDKLILSTYNLIVECFGFVGLRQLHIQNCSVTSWWRPTRLKCPAMKLLLILLHTCSRPVCLNKTCIHKLSPGCHRKLTQFICSLQTRPVLNVIQRRLLKDI